MKISLCQCNIRHNIGGYKALCRIRKQENVAEWSKKFICTYAPLYKIISR